jgi:DNA helicase-2/ATP-dependent DNA helicase PcrA
VVDRVLEAREGGLQLKHQAVLFRSSSHSGPLEIELTRRNIPFVKYGGLKFLDAAHVKDMLALLRFIQNPRDRVSGFRVLQLLPGVGPTSAGRIVETMGAAPRPFDALTETRPQRAEGWVDFLALVNDLTSSRIGWPTELERARLWYEPLMENAYDDAAVRVLDLHQLAQIASGYPSRERFLTELTLDPPDATSDQAGPPLLDEDYLILSTIHSAKGQEWRSVHVLNVVDGCIPSDLGTGSTHELEEERRLLYVAMTRARDQLHLVVPQRFYPHQQRPGGDRHVYAQRSRFITKPMLGHFDDIYWPPLAPVGEAGLARPQASLDVAAQMRGMWAK